METAVAVLAVAGTMIVQISLLKIDPWSALARADGRANQQGDDSGD